MLKVECPGEEWMAALKSEDVHRYRYRIKDCDSVIVWKAVYVLGAVEGVDHN